VPIAFQEELALKLRSRKSGKESKMIQKKKGVGFSAAQPTTPPTPPTSSPTGTTGSALPWNSGPDLVDCNVRPTAYAKTTNGPMIVSLPSVLVHDPFLLEDDG
jgi:hypothetical protein